MYAKLLIISDITHYLSTLVGSSTDRVNMKNEQSITAPLAAFVMALILAAYSIKRIRDAKYRFSGAPSSALEAAYERSEERRRRALRKRGKKIVINK